MREEYVLKMDGNYNYRPKSQNRIHKRNRLKDRGSKSYESSSDEDDYRSDDNLRPYEEVKVAHHDKKLNGLGLTPKQHAFYADDSHDTSGPHSNNSRLYTYNSGSEGEMEPDDNPGTRHTSLNVHHLGSQCSISSNELEVNVNGNPRHGTVSQLSLSDSDQENVTNSPHQPTATTPMLPPSLPNPPPPPPIEDIPQRTPVCSSNISRQRSFGPSHRGNYSDAETCVCGTTGSRHYAETQISNMPYRTHHPEIDNQNIRHVQNCSCPYSEGESDFEPHYIEQTPSGNVFIPDPNSPYPRSMPRSDSVPMSRSGGSSCPQNMWSPGANTVPVHYPNGGNHVDSRHTFTHPNFCQGGVGFMGGPYPPTTQDYTKFGCPSQVEKKPFLVRKCSWKIATFIFIILCVILLATTALFAAMVLFEEEVRLENDSAFNSSRQALGANPDFQVASQFRVGDVKQGKIPPHTFWTLNFTHDIPNFIKFNFSIPSSALLAFYARRKAPPTLAQFDYYEVLDGSKLSPNRYIRAAEMTKRSSSNRDTALIQYMEEGTWFLAVFNDRNYPEYISFKTETYDTPETNCPNDCHRKGECKNGQCQCYPGYTSWDCSEKTCPVLCSGNGDFIKGACVCHQGWQGGECEIPISECISPNCNNHGVCINGMCKCNRGFKGSDCSIVDCLVPNCSGNGICHLGTCICFKGYKGIDCSQTDRLNFSLVCSNNCSGHGVYDFEIGICICERYFTGPNCEKEICKLQCEHGYCRNQKCICTEGWGGALCGDRSCDPRCDGLRGQCHNGTCICRTGWNGKHCTLDGCPGACNDHGECRLFSNGYSCDCHPGWKGEACNVQKELNCNDGEDNDRDSLADCLDPDCCETSQCKDSNLCQQSPEPLDILMKKQPPSSTAPFFEKIRFLTEENSVQMEAQRNTFSESLVSLIRGRITSNDGTPLIGVRVAVYQQPLYGFTMSRKDGLFDIVVNGGGSVTLEFARQPFQTASISVLVPWNEIISIDTVVMLLESEVKSMPGAAICDIRHDYYTLQPVVLSTWQHTQLGSCPDRSTIIPESQVVQESLNIPGTKVNLVYHSSETPGYKSVILIQLTPEHIPDNLAMIHLKVSVQGIQVEKVFEADPGLKYTFSWDRKNAFRQTVYGIVPATVRVGYQYRGCNTIFWEVRSTTMSGYALAMSQIGGWNLDILHSYNYQEGILHKGDGTNIYMKEKPKKLVNILGNGYHRDLNCNTCNGDAKNNGLMSPVALASGSDGSLYVWDLDYVRKVSPERADVASILRTDTTSISHKPYMTVSPVNGHLYLSDIMNHRIIRIATMGPVRDLEKNFITVAGNGELCTPGAIDRCGDGQNAREARLSNPKGIAISKDNVMYIADNTNIRMVASDGKIQTIIGSQGQPRQFEPMSCDYNQRASEVRLQWPTDLAIDPLDNTLHILDGNVILKLTNDGSLITVAGRPLNCPFAPSNVLPNGVLSDDEQASSIAADVKLVNPQSIAFGPDGNMYVVESDSHSINRVRVVSTDGHIHHFAGSKSKCDCTLISCKCYDPQETFAAQALFKELKSVTVTPDGVVHIADAGNLRVFSVLSELPQPDERNRYEVVSPETQETYIFNHYGHHLHTVNIMTDQYVYNFTYDRKSLYGKLVQVTDDVGNNIDLILDGEKTVVREIKSPDNSRCALQMDNIRRLRSFTNGNHSFVFSYPETTGLLEAKYISDGRSFRYQYDNMGRLLEVVQPTGETTSLVTDVNTTGSIVHISTDNKDMVAMATYGSVQSVMHVMAVNGVAETKVTYLPDGAVVVMFPSNLTVTVMSRGHPVLDSPHRMNFKRKIIGPKNYHRLEWRHYALPRTGRSEQPIRRLEQRMRVGSPSQHELVHADQSLKAKGLQINGINVLNIVYDRVTHTEMILNHKMEEIMSILYDGSGLPTHFSPSNDHHGMNITYKKDGRIAHWQYGEMREERIYDVNGRLRERIPSSSTGSTRYQFRYNDGDLPTLIILPSGLQYTLTYDSQGNLEQVRTPGLGVHQFQQVISMGVNRLMYKMPGLHYFYIEEYDGNGKLLQVIYPSETKKVTHRYNSNSQRIMTLHDDTVVTMEYDPQVGKVIQSEVVSGSYHCQESFTYIASLVNSSRIQFADDRRLLGASFTYEYDKNFRLVTINSHFKGNATAVRNITYDEITGLRKSIQRFNIEWPLSDIEKISDDFILIEREYDRYGRIDSVKYMFGDQEKFRVRTMFDVENRVHNWNSKVRGEEKNMQYIYDVNSNLIEVLLNQQSTWRYGYDNNGNINKINNNGTFSMITFTNGDRITKSGLKLFTYDHDGFLVRRHDMQFSYDSNGQVTVISLRNDYRIFFYYDAQGRRVIQTEMGSVFQFFYSDVTIPDQITHTFNRTSGELTHYLYDDKNRLLAMERGGQMYYIGSDPMGTPIAVYDSQGVLVKHRVFCPLGQLLYDSNPGFELSFGFRGGFFSPVTGLVFFGNRMYDPENGHWLTPDYSSILNNLDKLHHNPTMLNNYQFSGFIDVKKSHLTDDQPPMMSISSWLLMLGIDLDSLAPDVSYEGEIRPKKSKDRQMMPMSSAFECTFIRDMKNLLTMSIVPKSQVSPLITVKDMQPALVSYVVLPGVKVTNINNVAVVVSDPSTHEIIRRTAEVFMNQSQIVDLRYNINGRDVHYLVKPNVSEAEADLTSLGIYGTTKTLYNNITISVKRLTHGERFHIGIVNPEVDVRIHGENTVVNIRYGTTVEREKHRILNHAKQRAIDHAWSREKWIIQNGLTPTFQWSDSERKQILETGRADGYEGHHIRSPETYPELSDDCNNIRFTKRSR